MAAVSRAGAVAAVSRAGAVAASARAAAVVGAALAVAVVAGGLSGAEATAGASAGAVHQPPPSAGTVPAWRGHGELAVISDGRLRLVDNDSRTYAVPGPGVPGQPGWSPDGKWVAFLRTPTGPALEAAASALWAARADGTGAHRVSAPGEDVAQWAWGPAGAGGETLAFSSFSSPSATAGDIFLASGPTMPRRFASYAGLIGFSWSPSGNALAVSYRKGPVDQPGTGEGFLEIRPLDGRAGRTVYRLADFGYVDLAGWWPDGKGLLFWDDPAGSASIAADGLVLDSLDLATLKPSPLATTLVHPNWVAWSPTGRTVAVVAGGDREIWYSDKHVELCAIPAATCRGVPLPSGDVMSLDPAWTGTGSLVYVLAPAAGPTTADPDHGWGPRDRRLGPVRRLDQPERHGLVRRAALVHLEPGRYSAPFSPWDRPGRPRPGRHLCRPAVRTGQLPPAPTRWAANTRHRRPRPAGPRRLRRQLLRLHRLVPGFRLAPMTPGVPPGHRTNPDKVMSAADPADRRPQPDRPALPCARNWRRSTRGGQPRRGA